MAILTDLGDGTLKIRMHTVPDSAYAVNLVYQAKAPIKVALTDTWAPFPDSVSSLYRQALLYRMYRYINSPLQTIEYQKLKEEIAKAQGSDDAEQTDVNLQPEEGLMGNDYGWGIKCTQST